MTIEQLIEILKLYPLDTKVHVYNEVDGSIELTSKGIFYWERAQILDLVE